MPDLLSSSTDTIGVRSDLNVDELIDGLWLQIARVEGANNKDLTLIPM